MAIIMVTYDLKKPGRNYQPVYDYLESFTYCKGVESLWLLDTSTAPSVIRDELNGIIDYNDITYVVRLTKEWASHRYPCSDWLKSSDRDW